MSRITSVLASTVLAVSLSVAPAHAAIVRDGSGGYGQIGQGPIGNPEAGSDYATIHYSHLPTVVQGQTTTIRPTSMTRPDGSVVTDPAAEGYTFSTSFVDGNYELPFRDDIVQAAPDGTLTITASDAEYPGINEVAVAINNPKIGPIEYTILRIHVVPSTLADATNEKMDVVHYRDVMAEQGFSTSRPPEIWSRETTSQLKDGRSGYRYDIVSPDPAKGWTVPAWVFVDKDTGTFIANPPKDQSSAKFVVPISIQDVATGETTMSQVTVSVEPVRDEQGRSRAERAQMLKLSSDIFAALSSR